MPPTEFVHQFRNFGEDVYRDLKEECTMSIDEIDASTSVFYVRDLRAGAAGRGHVLTLDKSFHPPGGLCRLSSVKTCPLRSLAGRDRPGN
jgi:hypothetical protein